MAIEKITIHKHITCKRCGSDKTVRKGKKNGLQYYWCKSCKYWFSGNDSFPNKHYNKQIIANSLGMYYRGIPTSQIDEQIKAIYGVSINQSTIYRWIIKYSQQAINITKQLKPELGTDWVVDETAIKINGQLYWYWDVIDYDTRFLVCSYISKTRTLASAIKALNRCKGVGANEPKIIITDKLPAYLQAMKAVYPNAKHLKSQGFAADINTNLIERFHGTLKQRYKVLRRMKSIETAQIILDGFVVFYNFIKLHSTLGDNTPASVAGIRALESWEDIINLCVET